VRAPAGERPLFAGSGDSAGVRYRQTIGGGAAAAVEGAQHPAEVLPLNPPVN